MTDVLLPPLPERKMAPVQGWPQGIPWSLHLEAYAAYCKKWGPQPALIDLEGRNCRGGFGTGELDEFIPGWRERVSEITALREQLAHAAAVSAAKDARIKVLEDALAMLLNCRNVEQRLKALHEMGYGTDYDQHRQQFAKAWITARAALGDKT